MNKSKKFLLIPIIIFFISRLPLYSRPMAEAAFLSGRKEWSPGFSTSGIQITNTADEPGLLSSYAQTCWPSIHRDSRNSNYVPFVTAAQLEPKWHALMDEYSAVLTAAVIGPEGNVYFTTGKEESYGNLHAFDRQGNELWRSYLPDNGALCSAPLIDRQGDIYLGDSDEFFSFHPDGSLKWKNSGINGPFASAAFTRDGYIVGIGASGWTYVFDPENGHLAAPPMEIPGQSPGKSYKVFTPPGLWQGMICDGDHLTINEIFNGLLGFEFKIANTPGVNPVNGRIYITGSIKSPVSLEIQGRFYGIDFIPPTSQESGRLQLAFQTPMEPGSGSSPAISADGSRIYALDNKGTLYAFDADGTKAWTLGMKAKPASPTIGPDGTIYGVSEGLLYAIKDRGSSGEILWKMDFSETMIATLFNSLSSLVENLPYQVIKSAIQCNSVVTASKNHLYLTLALGYEFALGESNLSNVYPLKSYLVVLTPSSKQKKTLPLITSIVEIPDTSESVISLDKDGTVFCAHASITSSIAYSIAQRLGFDPEKPSGGVSVLAPVNTKDMIRSHIRWVRDLILQVLQALRQNDVESAWANLEEPMAHLQLLMETFSREANSDANTVIEAGKQDVVRAYAQLEAAQSILEEIRNTMPAGGTAPRRQSAVTTKARMHLRSALNTCRSLEVKWSVASGQ
ncbi:MAG: PQQ-binding-like beta-propeller repeat protein [bacterium]